MVRRRRLRHGERQSWWGCLEPSILGAYTQKIEENKEKKPTNQYGHLDRFVSLFPFHSNGLLLEDQTIDSCLFRLLHETINFGLSLKEQMDVLSQYISQIVDLSHEHADFVVLTKCGGIGVVVVHCRSYRRPKIFINRIGIARTDLPCRIFPGKVSSDGL